MKKPRKIRGLNGTINDDPTFDHEQISKALLDLEDTFIRCVMPFILLEGAAKQLYENLPFQLKELSIGVLEKDWTEYGKTTFKILHPEAEVIQVFERVNDQPVTRDTCMSLKVNGVPTDIWIIHKNYKFFVHPDFRWYRNTEFYLPNPFKSYWSCRFIIK